MSPDNPMSVIRKKIEGRATCLDSVLYDKKSFDTREELEAFLVNNKEVLGENLGFNPQGL